MIFIVDQSLAYFNCPGIVGVCSSVPGSNRQNQVNIAAVPSGHQHQVSGTVEPPQYQLYVNLDTNLTPSWGFINSTVRAINVTGAPVQLTSHLHRLNMYTTHEQHSSDDLLETA